jgi:nucleoside-diphosphate-sugar epimerase
MKIFVTGAAGFIGSHIARALTSPDNDIFVGMRNPPIGIRGGTTERVSYIFGDLAEGLEINSELDVIIHAAASLRLDSDYSQYIRSNILGTQEVARLCKVHGVKKLVYLSSTSIYGEVHEDLLTENLPVRNPNMYGLTKYVGEGIVSTLKSDVSTYVLRLPGVVGSGAKQNFLARTKLAAQSGHVFEVAGGDNFYNHVVHVSDLAALIKIIIHRDISEHFVGNLASRTPVRISELVEIIRGIYPDFKTRELNEPVRNYTISVEHLAKTFNFNPMMTAEAVRRFFSE